MAASSKRHVLGVLIVSDGLVTIQTDTFHIELSLRKIHQMTVDRQNIPWGTGYFFKITLPTETPIVIEVKDRIAPFVQYLKKYIPVIKYNP